MATDRRTNLERRRIPPGQHVDVTRIEHENLCTQMDEVLRTLRRIEGELRMQSQRIGTLEQLSMSRPRTANGSAGR